MNQSVELKNSMTLMKSRHNNIHRHLTGTARRASFLSNLLRTALLLGAFLLSAANAQAQTPEQWAAMPDAFETMDPASIIGDGNYYYIQFYQKAHDKCSYLTDCGVNSRAKTRDFLPYANNRLWTLVAAGDGNSNHFKLRSKTGRYVKYGSFSGGNRFGCVEGFENATILTFHVLDDGYDISQADDEGYPMYRPTYNEWTDLAKAKKYSNSQSYNLDLFRLRFAKLKSNAAFIIYYRGEGTDNDNSASATTRHYLTYSGTGNQVSGSGTLQTSDVSSRQSIMPKDKPLPSLPTLAAYHKDGLWTLEESGDDGGFYIKKYGTNDYLINSSGNYSILGAKDIINAKYNVENTDVNRYTPIQKVNYEQSTLTRDMFHTWDGYGSGATVTNNSPAVDFNVGNGAQIGQNAMVAGTSNVDRLIYADLSEYSKMIINGTQEMKLRVLLSRQEGPANTPNEGPIVEKNVTIGNDGTIEVSLKNLELNSNHTLPTRTGTAAVKMTYVNGSSDAVDISNGEVAAGYPAYCGFNKISNGNTVNLANTSYGVNNIAYLQVDATAINGTISKVTLTGDFQQISARGLEYGVGYNNSPWSSAMTWNSADRSITILDETQTVSRSSDDTELSFNITEAFRDSKLKTILVYNLQAGGGYIKNPRVEVEYTPSNSDVNINFAHLNAIKTASDSPDGTITSITLLKETTGARYLHYSKGDGWQVEQWTQKHTSPYELWDAAFYPVEVPDPNQDKYYRVLAGFNNGYGVDGKMLTETGWLADYSDVDGERQLLFLSQEDDYQHFYLKTPLLKYIRSTGGTTNNKADGERLTNTSLYDKFYLKWYYVDPKQANIVIDNRYREVEHKTSYLRNYVTESGKSQGLIGNADSDWRKNTNGPQMVNEFMITHYVRRGNTRQIVLPTTLRVNNDHVFYQRWYIGNDEENLAKLQQHVSLNVDGGNGVAYYIYKNGLVTGQKLRWDDYPNYSEAEQCVQYRFSYTNPLGVEEELPITADVSRYSDLTYKGSDPYNGNLEEPSLTMRYIYNMNDAKSMAKRLMYFTGSNGWKEDKPIRFPVKRLDYEQDKNEAYRGDFLSLRHLFRDYWIFDDPAFIKEFVFDEKKKEYVGVIDYDYIKNKTDYNAEITTNYGEVTQETMNKFLDDHLVSAVMAESSGIGRIKIELQNNYAGLSLGGHKESGVAQGYYLYDEVYNKKDYGGSRFMVFNYPSDGEVDIPSGQNSVSSELTAYFEYTKGGATYKYQICRYTIIFEKLSDPTIDNQTKPWRDVKGTNRDPNKLRDIAGPPIAKVTFDYPDRSESASTKNFYHIPQKSDGSWYDTKHNNGTLPRWVNEKENESDPDNWVSYGDIPNSSPIPLPFDKTNYSFDGENCSWGSYALVSKSFTTYGYQKDVLPSNTKTDPSLGYGIDPDAGMQDGFMYIDASEMPGDICSISFQGDFCQNDKLMCTGWISGANKKNWDASDRDKRCPGGITLTMKGEDENGETKTIYRFCPGQCYELTATDDSHVEWQQFYFEFSTDKKYKRYWMEVNNNCVSSNGGDFMLDNIEVYAIVPKVEADINTPLCVSVDEDGNTVTEMRLLKLRIDHNKLKSSRNVNGSTAEEGFVFLNKYKFLDTFRTELLNTYPSGFNGFNFNTITLDELALAIEKGELSSLPSPTEGSPYKTAFDAAILGEKTTWHSSSPTVNMGASVMYYTWSTTFENDNYMPEFSFADAVNKNHAVYREVVATEEGNVNYVVINGNYTGLKWETNTDYYVINTNQTFESGNPCTAFNLCSECCKAGEFRIKPPLEVLGLDAAENMEDLVVCDGQIPTLLTNLKGYDIKGKEVKMKNLNFDWWLGNKRATNPEDRRATLANYHKQHKEIDGVDVYLAYALSTMRAYYPGITSLDGITKHQEEIPYLTVPMIKYLKEVVATGELLLHQTTVSVPAEQVLDSDPYFYMVACPIHDEMFDQALNPSASEYVAFYCDEPQGVRIKLGQKAPRLQTGFVPGEHGFSSYSYNFPEGTNPVLSIRLAKAAQFETVKNTDAEGTTPSNDVNYLWLPIRNAQTEGAGGVIKKSQDDNIYLASSNDLTWDKKISKEMNTNKSLPVVGRIVRLEAINTKDNSEGAQQGATVNISSQIDKNYLSVYFVKDFNVREGYNYTLSLPFQEDDNSNACDGTILINLKIVPDYEVWTGGAGNIDWNNDENWRRADGNTTISNAYYGDELYRANGAVYNNASPLHEYVTNKDNYYSSSKKANAKPSKDQVLRKGFTPLYCTHVLMKSDEWGNAPELYDALDVETAANNGQLKDAPFPNLRDTSTPILKFDMQARKYSMWSETYGTNPDRGRSDHPNDLIAEMYKVNSCDEIAFQPGTELRNAHLLNYNNAWVEYELDNKRWYLLGSPLQGTISGEWYAPSGTAQQKTTYYDPVTFIPHYVKVAHPRATDNPSQRGWYTKSGENYSPATDTEVSSSTDYYYLYQPSWYDDYDRYSPAIYQRSWDKAKAVLYEVGADYDTNDDSQTENLGSPLQGQWSNSNWDTTNADRYLDRLGYKPMGDKKVNVAMKGIWSNTYNDATVDYAKGGFSVMVMNHLKNNDNSGGKAIVRLPKEDTMYDYYKYSETNTDDGGTDTELSDVRSKNRALNRGRLKADQLLPQVQWQVTATGTAGEGTGNTTPVEMTSWRQETEASIYGDMRTYTRVPTTEAPLQSMNGANFSFTETVPAGASNLGFYLVENPFTCGLDMAKFFAANSVTFTQDEIDNASEGDPAYGKTTNDVKSGLERKYWLLTKTAEGQNPRQVLVQLAPNGEWITSDGDAVEYQNPNYVAPGAGDPEPTEPETLQFLPHAVVAPGQGFFVQATGISGDLTVTFNRDMQAQSRFGMIEGMGTKYTIVVGQSQVMRPLRKMIDTDDDGIPDTENPDETSTDYETIDVDLNGNGIYGETYTEEVEVDGEMVTKTIVEKEPVQVPVYEEIDDPDNPGETIKILKLEDIEEEVTIYKYVPETLTITPDDPNTPSVDESVTYDKEYPLLSRQTRGGNSTSPLGMVITAKRGADESSALVMLRESASDDFLPAEDTETFINSDLKNIPTVYTLCGRLATTINSIHDFTCLPLGVESSSNAPCVLTLQGVELLGDSVSFYDAVERKLTPLESGMKFTVSGQTQNRYYLVKTLIEEEAAEETHLQIFTEGHAVKVIASTAEPIISVRCFDTNGRLVHQATPQSMDYSFTVANDGIYVIEARTEKDRKTKKVIVK